MAMLVRLIIHSGLRGTRVDRRVLDLVVCISILVVACACCWPVCRDVTVIVFVPSGLWWVHRHQCCIAHGCNN